MTYRVVETPLGWLAYAHGEQIGQPHSSPGGAFAVAIIAMRDRGDGRSGGSFVLDWDGSYRWHDGEKPQGKRGEQ